MDENLSDLKIFKKLRVRILSCEDPDCTAPGGMATDFNMWDRAMVDEELVDWTTCK